MEALLRRDTIVRIRINPNMYSDLRSECYRLTFYRDYRAYRVFSPHKLGDTGFRPASPIWILQQNRY